VERESRDRIGRKANRLVNEWKLTPDGSRIPERKIFTGATRHEVATDLTAALRDRDRDRDRGLNIEPEKQTVGAFLASWLENTVRPSVRPKTYRSYEQMVRNHLAKTSRRRNGRSANSTRFRA